MPDEKDELKIKRDEARTQLPAETRQAIDAVDWRKAIMDVRNKEGYDFIQLGELETETELLLSGLSSPEDYPKEIEKRMGISHEAAQKLLIDMNEKVFKRIREELIKITEKKPAIPTIPLPSQPAINITAEKGDLKNAGIEILNGSGATNSNHLESREEILKRLEKPELMAPHPILAEKLSGPMQIPSSKTIHSLDNLTKPSDTNNVAPVPQKPAPPKRYGVDPYRELPE